MACYPCIHCNKCGMYSVVAQTQCSVCATPISIGQVSCPNCGGTSFVVVSIEADSASKDASLGSSRN